MCVKLYDTARFRVYSCRSADSENQRRMALGEFVRSNVKRSILAIIR